jgi:predicted nucleic acid-binding protein
MLLKHGPKSISLLSAQAILDLTTYELGNGIWRLSNLQKTITKTEACSLLDACLKIVAEMNILDITNVETVVKELSSSTRQSFYDSAYIAVAKKHNLELVTDDKKLLNNALHHGIKASTSEK